MTYRPNSNNLVFFRGRGMKRGNGLQVRFNNRTGCRQVVCKKKKCKVKDNSPSFIKVGKTIYKFYDSEVIDNYFWDSGPGIYAINGFNDETNQTFSAWFFQFNGKTITYGSYTLLDECFPIRKIITIDEGDPTLLNYINNGKIKKIISKFDKS